MSRATTPIRRLAQLGATFGALLAMTVAASAAVPALTVKAAGRSPIAGIQDDRIPYASDPAERVRLLVDAGASLIRVDLRWDTVARARPAAPTNPADPSYDWRQYDAIVAAAATSGAEILFAVFGTPAWAADNAVRSLPNFVPGRFPDTAIRPLDPADFGAFGEAAARRYAPLGVRKWEGWNEANIALFLEPQYDRVGNRWVPSSPATYSALLRAFSAGVKRADASAIVAGAVTAPAGDTCATCPLSDPPQRIRPQDFIAALNAKSLRPPMDVVSHHPYPLSAPRSSTLGGRSYVDLYNLDVLTKAIDKTYLKGKRLWLTEYGFATRRVREYNVFFTPTQQANFISDAYRRAKANTRIDMTVYYLLQDHSGWASGVLNQAGQQKPAYQALGIPFATTTGGTSFARGATVSLVGQSRLGRGARFVEIQRKAGNRWVRHKRLRTSADGSFRVSLRLTAKIALRAKWTGLAPSGGATTRTSPAVTLTIR